MNKTIKNIIGVAGVIIGIIIAASIASYANTYSRSINPSSFRSFSVSAEGEALGIPNIAEFTAGVVTEGGMNIGELQEENTKKINAIIAYVKESGVEDKDIKTEGYSISPRYTSCYERVCPPRRVVGYTIASSVTIKARDFAKAGEMLSGVVKRGATNVSSLNFRVDDPDSYLKEARDEAIAKAKVKAKEIADSAGFKIGRLLSLNEGSFIPHPFQARDLYRMEAIAPAPASPVMIEPGSQEFTSMITLVYEIR